LRCFIALGLPADARELLARWADARREAIDSSFAAQGRGLPKISWVRPEAYHLTLAFLGELEGRALDAAAACLEAARGFGDIAFSFDGPGSFPFQGPWRVLHAGIRDGDRARELHRRINEELARLASEAGLPGINPEWPLKRPFSPHITLARAGGSGLSRPAGTEPPLGPPLAEPGSAARVFTIGRCSLYKSELRRGGSVYTEQRGVDLG
jgi:RNA 2',3'-cyclic 3'-phosphodiesterase